MNICEAKLSELPILLEFEQLIIEAERPFEENMKNQEEFQEVDPELLEKQQKLEELFEQIMSEEMKEMFERGAFEVSVSKDSVLMKKLIPQPRIKDRITEVQNLLFDSFIKLIQTKISQRKFTKKLRQKKKSYYLPLHLQLTRLKWLTVILPLQSIR